MTPKPFRAQQAVEATGVPSLLLAAHHVSSAIQWVGDLRGLRRFFPIQFNFSKPETCSLFVRFRNAVVWKV